MSVPQTTTRGRPVEAEPPPSGRARLEHLLGAWNYLVDPKVGIIRALHEMRPDDDDPDFFHYLSRASDTARFTAMKNFANNGGVSTTRYVAMAKAIGEAIERYCGAIFDYRDLVYSSYAELDRPATPPGAFALYRPEQFASEDFPWKPFDDDAIVAWTTGRSLVTGANVLVPAAMVFIPYHYLRSRRETPVVQPISTGIACGSSLADATLSGLCEAIERDAFTIMWQARLSRPHLDESTLPATVEDLLRRYSEVGLRVELMDITTDVDVPCVLSVALSDATTSPAVAVAAAVHPSMERACIQSLEELAHTRKFAKQLMDFTPELPVEVDAGHPEVQDQRHHLRFYCPQDAKQHAEFCWAAPERVPFRRDAGDGATSAEARLEVVVDELVRAGLEPVACDLTTPDIRCLGLSVVRVVVPGLNPLFMGHRNRALGGTRLYTVPQKLGLRGLEDDEPDNPYPHPFP